MQAPPQVSRRPNGELDFYPNLAVKRQSLPPFTHLGIILNGEKFKTFLLNWEWDTNIHHFIGFIQKWTADVRQYKKAKKCKECTDKLLEYVHLARLKDTKSIQIINCNK